MAPPFTLATFNVKDLFEATFAPDSRAHLAAKLVSLARVLEQAGADVVALQEVGSAEVVRALTSRVPSLGYGEPVLGTADARGIRCAIVSRAPVLESRVHIAEQLSFPGVLRERRAAVRGAHPAAARDRVRARRGAGARAGGRAGGALQVEPRAPAARLAGRGDPAGHVARIRRGAPAEPRVARGRGALRARPGGRPPPRGSDASHRRRRRPERPSRLARAPDRLRGWAAGASPLRRRHPSGAALQHPQARSASADRPHSRHPRAARAGTGGSIPQR